METSQRVGSGKARLDRRTFVQGGAAALPFVSLASGGLLQAGEEAPRKGQEELPDYPGLIMRESKPENYEFPFPTLNSFLTPRNRFYVRTHFGIYRDVDLRSWRLKVEGHVEHPLELSYDDLLRMPSRTQTALLECSGNSRVFLVPKPEGVLWELGAVGNADWTGVPLKAALDRAGVKSDALEVVCEGADAGELPGNKEEPRSPGKIHYARSLPLDKARKAEVLLAYRMNGDDLSAAHGFPVRLIVPGWYGMASVKWLKRLVVTRRPFQGFFQTMVYSYFEQQESMPTLVPTTELQVKAEIARPAREEIIRAGARYRVHGAAWTGESEVTKVEVSTNGGKTWSEARLLDRAVRHAWRLWEYPWQAPDRGGRHIFMARATDARGRTQPMKHDPARRNALVNHVLPIEVEVR